MKQIRSKLADSRVVFSVEEFAKKECGEIVKYMEKDKSSRIIGDTLGVDRMVISKGIKKKAGQVLRGSIPLTERNAAIRSCGKLTRKLN